MTHQEVLDMHTKNILDAYDAVEDGTPDMRTSLIWLLNVTESWVDQTKLEAREEAVGESTSVS